MRAPLFIALLAFSAAAPAATFDCSHARSSAEKVVCSNPELSDLDDVLGRYYRGAMAALQENGACLREDQLYWLRAKRAPCNGSTCLRNVYLLRLAELVAIQPGINAQRQLALPSVPSLVWAMAPQAAESPLVASRIAWIEGELRYDESAGAFVVRNAEGKSYELLPDIMRGGLNEATLTSLAQTPDGSHKVAARGRVVDDIRTPVPYFDHRYCTFIYRLPN